MSLLEQLQKIQSELKAPKSQYNNFGKYKYRSCEDILEALKPLLLKHQCILTISDTLECIGERYYIKAMVTLSSLDGVEKIDIFAYAREEETKKGMDGCQITGASSSYARKYALNGLFCIDDNKDSDTTNTKCTDDKKNYNCADCNNKFKSFVDKNGKTWNSEQVYHIAEETAKKKGIIDGKVRCSLCLDKVLLEREKEVSNVK